MGVVSQVKSVMPVSSRSFHGRFDDVNARLDRANATINAINDQVGGIGEHVDAIDGRINEQHDRIGAIDDQLRAMRDEQARQSRLLESLSTEAGRAKAFYLIGESGYPNYGDEFIAKQWLRYLAQVRPEVPVYLDCARPGPSATILRGIHPHASFTDTVARLTFENPYAQDDISRGKVRDIARFVGQALDDDGVSARYVAGLELIRHGIRGLHVIGGGYMNGRWSANLARLEAGAWAKRHGIPVIATGAGLMPLTEDNGSLGYAREAVASYDGFTVRDEVSAAALNGTPTVPEAPMPDPIAQVAPDDCFVNGLEGAYHDRDDLPRTMVCVQSDLVPDSTGLYDHVVAILEAWGVPKDEKVGVIECNPYIDYSIVPRLEEAGYTIEFFPLRYLLDLGFPAAAGQRWITTRYHPHILAAFRGCSGVFVPVDAAYYGVKHNAVLRMGSRWNAAPIGQPIPEAGPGADDAAATAARYRDEIRRSASMLYGM